MKSKLSWITFVPLTIAAVIIKLTQIFYLSNEGSTLNGLTSFQLSYIAIGAVVLILLFTLLFVLIDRKTAPYYQGGKNFAAGIFGLLIAVLMACDGANRIFNIVQLGSFEILGLIDSILTLLSAVVFVVIGLSHFTGNAAGKGLALFYLFPAIWSAIRLISTFLEFRTVSIYTVDATRFIVYILLTLFLFNYAILISRIQGKSPVKVTLVYAFPACAALIMFAVYEITQLLTSGASIDFLANAEYGVIALLAVYVFIFLIEITIRVKTKDEVVLVEDNGETKEKKDEEDDLEIEEFDKSFANEVITGLDNDTVVNAPAHTYLETQDTSGFIYQVTPQNDDGPGVSNIYGNINEKEVSDFITSIDSDYGSNDTVIEEPEPVKTEPIHVKKEEPVKVKPSAPVSKQSSRMDEIDKLIFEISNDKK